MDLTKTLRTEYQSLWDSCAIRPVRLASVDAIADRVVAQKARYRAAGRPVRMPWAVIAAIHMLESSGSFERHLHNGDPLTARTVQVPAGRPAKGRPPFTWEESAADALALRGFDSSTDWSVPGALFQLERYNGFGYRPRNINSPYLWSFSNQYSKGKFVADGTFSATAVSAQCGAAVLLKRLVERGDFEFRKPRAKPPTTTKPPPEEKPDADVLAKGARGPKVVKLKERLKKWFDVAAPGQWEKLAVADDDLFGAKLVRAVKIFQARNGLDDDGEVGEDTREALKRRPVKPGVAKVADLAFPAGMKRGSTGTRVRMLQSWLSLANFHVAVDSGFGDATEEALRQFQRARKLPVTGKLDERTWRLLTRPMASVLEPIPPRKSLGLQVVAYARRHLSKHPREIGGQNRGPWVRLYTDGREGNAFPWCAGFATYILKQASETMGVPMPVVKTLGCDAMAASAGKRFLPGAKAGDRSRIRPGSFFLKLETNPGPGKPKYMHTGIVVSAGPTTMSTIEGNTNDDGSAEGFEVCKRTRGYAGMDFIVL